mgnify:CR=1 FL=1
MKKKRKVPPAKPPRNPHARVLGQGPFKAKVLKNPDAYVRRSRHSKPLKDDVQSED